MIDASRIEKIIIRLPNWIGDAVMAIPAVNCIKKNFPHINVTCLGKPSVNQLYRYNTNVDRLIAFKLPEGKNKLSGIKEFSRGLRHFGFDSGLILPDSFSSALVFKLGGIKRRIGYRSELRSFLLTDAVNPPKTLIHRSQRYISLVRHVFGIDGCDHNISIPVSESEIYNADIFLKEIKRFAVVCPTSRAPSRRWGGDKYAELIRRLINELDLDIVLAGSKDESQIIERVGEQSGVDFLNLANENDLLLSIEVMRRSEVFVGNDSGAAHLAAASGTRVVSISGADDPRETRPLAAIGKVVNKEIQCSPCVKNICPREDHVNECMELISVNDVFNEITQILKHEK